MVRSWGSEGKEEKQTGCITFRLHSLAWNDLGMVIYRVPSFRDIVSRSTAQITPYSVISSIKGYKSGRADFYSFYIVDFSSFL